MTSDLLKQILSLNSTNPQEGSVLTEEYRALFNLPDSSSEMVIQDVCLASNLKDHSPERVPDTVFSWDYSRWDCSPERPPSKRMKYNNDSMGSSCSSPAMSETSEIEESLSDLSNHLIEGVNGVARKYDIIPKLFQELSWMDAEDFVPPPPPKQGTLPWENSTTRWSSCSRKQKSSLASSIWSSNKKWSQLKVYEQREALNCLMHVTEELGLREKLDINHILNIDMNSNGPIVIDLNTLNDDKWRLVKMHIRRRALSHQEVKSTAQRMSPDHVYLSQKRPTCPVSRQTVKPSLNKQTYRAQTSGHSSTATQTCKIKHRTSGAKKYQTSSNSLLKKNILNKVTETANRGVGMKVAVSDVKEAVSGLFYEEEKIVLTSSTEEVDVDILG